MAGQFSPTRTAGSRPGLRARLARLALGLVVVVLAIVGLRRFSAVAVVSPEATERYLRQLDIDAMQRLGCDFTAARFVPGRLGMPVAEIDSVRDYDFALLRATEKRLAGVDRRVALREVAQRVCADATTNVERHERLLNFVQRVSFHHSILRPIREDGTPAFDPLVHLELNEMRCGAVSRLTVDLFQALGIPGRTVMLAGHIAAEVHYDEAWHLIDADNLGGNGIGPRREDGTVPSCLELSRSPGMLDALPFKYELGWTGRPRTGGTEARSNRYFVGTSDRVQEYCTKRPGSWLDANFGWRDDQRAPVEWALREGALRYQPGAVRFREVRVEGGTATVSWHEAVDRDDDLLGYRVYAATSPRGWSYASFAGAARAEPYWHDTGGWRPEMYDALYRMPPSDLEIIETSETSVRIALPAGRPAFVTVMAFDAYHEQAGKTMYLMSNELRLEALP